ncbi:MAG: multifunctional CCA addition/repair protein [Burkholderiaceae bacterium]|jgi:tRNA nucleotidyltransferase (CCA-adding enzyme)|nr:multifunctional CCA addition/repair protein [Burkholderiaceae bacterium]
MRVYLVGGAVRDGLLGLPVQDSDWVVVGATPQDMVAQGYQPVGRDFPVFLHPQTHEEYALARTERKSGRGYRGFTVYADPGVTLEQDLARRDLTINAIAQDASGALIDPFGGQRDLRDKVLRHVTDAFREDPVRILRVARFAARFAGFAIAPETLALMRGMVTAGEVAHLVPERVWQELARGLMEAHPARMLEALRACGALAVALPEVDGLWGVPQPIQHHPEVDTGAHLLLALDMAAQLTAPLAVRYAVLAHDLGKGATPASILPRHIGHEQRGAPLAAALSARLRAPADCAGLADLVAREHGHNHASGALNAQALVRLLERCDALRRPERFAQALLACECDARGRLGRADAAYPQRPRLLAALSAAQAVDTAAIAAAAQASGERGPAIGARISAARAQAVARTLNTEGKKAP